MAKKKNSRKALAVALGIMGIAGLSVASASQLTVTPGSEAAMGTSTDLFASCDTAVGVEYTFDTDYNIDSVSITGLDDDCNGSDIEFTIENLDNADVTGSATGLAFTSTVTDDNTWKFDITSPSVSIEDDLGTATVVIS